jgi:hypothetical protein
LTARARTEELLAFVSKRLHQLIEGVDELLRAFVLQLPGDAVEIHTHLLEVAENLLRLVQISFDRISFDHTMVGKGIDRLVGHGIDGVRPNERLHIAHVMVERIFRARASPQRPLDVGTVRRQCLPPWSAENPLKTLIGELRIGNGHFADERLGPWRVSMGRRRLDAMP